MTADFVNASFEMLGIIFMIPTFFKSFRTKIVRGISPLTPTFFLMWGCFNIYYYSSLIQPYSAIAAVGMVLANSIWLYMVVKYSE